LGISSHAELILMAVQPLPTRRVSLSDDRKTVALPAAVLRRASDERLVERVRAGSERAFEVVYDRHQRGILAFCRHMLGSVEEAEDAVQHTFMAAFRDLEGSTKAIQLRPWLYTIARNRCLSVLRARREHPVAEVEAPPTENLSAEVERRQDLRDLLGDLARLPDDQRAALVLAELGAAPHEEIAVVLGVPREKVKALVFQARTSLTASRRARETPCVEIREQLAVLRGGALRRSPLHRHLRECAGCREFHGQVKAQRRDLGVILPVAPTLALKEAVLAAVFGSGAGGGGAIAAAGGGALAAKALVAVALVGGGTVSGIEALRVAARPDRASARSAERTASTANRPVRPTTPRPVGAAAVPVAVVEQERAQARPRKQRTSRRTHRSDSRVQGTDRLRPQPEQRSKSHREEKLHAKRPKGERKAENKLRPARPKKLKRALNERSARPHSAASPAPKAPRKAKPERKPKPVAKTTPDAEPTVTPDLPEADSKAHGRSHR
jgi:RNA polymerase sigma factor (sigma-70 family)